MTALDRLISVPRRNTDDDAWQARIEARLDAQHARAAMYAAVRVQAFETATKPPAKVKAPAKVKTPRISQPPKPPRIRPATLRPCGGCGHPTRSNQLKAADYPGTRPRARHGLCSTCAEKPSRPRTGTRTPRVTDAELAGWIDAHKAGKSAHAIARDAGRQRNTVMAWLRKAAA